MKKIKPASEINVNLHKHDNNLLMDNKEEKLSEINVKPNRKMKQFKARYIKDIKQLNLNEIWDNSHSNCLFFYEIYWYLLS